MALTYSIIRDFKIIVSGLTREQVEIELAKMRKAKRPADTFCTDDIAVDSLQWTKRHHVAEWLRVSLCIAQNEKGKWGVAPKRREALRHLIKRLRLAWDEVCMMDAHAGDEAFTVLKLYGFMGRL